MTSDRFLGLEISLTLSLKLGMGPECEGLLGEEDVEVQLQVADGDFCSGGLEVELLQEFKSPARGPEDHFVILLRVDILEGVHLRKLLFAILVLVGAREVVGFRLGQENRLLTLVMPSLMHKN